MKVNPWLGRWAKNTTFTLLPFALGPAGGRVPRSEKRVDGFPARIGDEALGIIGS
jgi:hypothetical protein